MWNHHYSNRHLALVGDRKMTMMTMAKVDRVGHVICYQQKSMHRDWTLTLVIWSQDFEEHGLLMIPDIRK